jgi:tetratricopeptide (TPR) repeat protein
MTVVEGGQVALLLDRAREAARGYRLAEAERLLRRAVRAPDDVRARVLLTLSYVRAERGDLHEGLALLADPVLAGAGGHLAGMVHGQHGLLLLRAGRLPLARRQLDLALDLLDDGTVERAQTLLNRGFLALSEGRLAAARRDFADCARQAHTLTVPALAGQASHNLACLALLSGDLPRALSGFDAAAEVLRSWDGLRHVHHLDRARALVAAGLLTEADEELSLAVARLTGAVRNPQDLAEVELLRAQVAGGLDRPVEAAELARRARRRFVRRGSTTWALVARLAEVRARQAGVGGRPVPVAEIERLATDLDRQGLVDDAREAGMCAVRARIDAGDLAGAGSACPRPRRGEPVTARLGVRGLRADLALAAGRRARGLAELRTGLRELHRYQATFGSLDLRTAVSRHGNALARRGLTVALAGGRAAEVFAWSERARALASRLPPVVPPRDPVTAELLEALRFTRTELRDAELSGRDVPGLRVRAAELERRIRRRSWYTTGSGEVAEPVRYRQVRAGLDSESLVAHLLVDGDLHALVTTARGGHVVPLGPAGPLLSRLRQVRADLDVLASTGLPTVIDAAVRRSLRSGLADLAHRLWDPLAGRCGSGTVVLVPSGPLTAAPWTLLPGLRGRELVVARSATTWFRDRDPLRSTPSGRASPVCFVAGPDLARAEEEVRAAAALWPSSLVLVGPAATAAAVRSAFAGPGLVHVAAHGVHEAGNPLFSSLVLGDGPLFGYDVTGGPPVPHQVVLSACDLGRVTTRPGDEVLGMTAALLHAGVRSVLAGVARVNDDVACEVMLAYHRGLRSGLSSAAALAAAIGDRQDAPFLCFGTDVPGLDVHP